MTEQKLYRDKTNHIVGGVAAGLGNYFNLDPLLIRILFVLLAIFGGGGVIIYFILWIFVPDNQKESIYNSTTMENQPYEQQNKPNIEHDNTKGSLISGIILITLGAMFLADRFIPHIRFGDLWPIILIVIGAVLISNNFIKNKKDEL